MAKKKSKITPSKPTATASHGTFTDTRRVEELIALMAANGLSEIELSEANSRILLRRGVPSAGGSAPAQVFHAPAPSHAPAASPVPAPKPAEDDKLRPIKSIMVGTFYSAPSPDAGPYVSVGSHVDDKTVVCIIEAMKVFNPIAAETTGTIVKVLVSNGQVVEFGQPLFLVKPD